MKEITPLRLRCQDSLVCPAVFEDEGYLIIIGKRASVNLKKELLDRIVDDEEVIVISKEYFISVK